MAIRNYLSIVNDSIAECKVSLDPLTSVTFADPPRTVLYNSFKRWCNKAYRDLMIERSEWFFRVERTSIQLQPRLHLSGLSYIPAIGDVLESDTSGVQFTITGLHTFEDNEVDTIVERTVDVTYTSQSDPRDFLPLEQLNRVSPSPLNNVGFLKAPGRYNFADEIIGFDELDMESVRAYYDNTAIASPLTAVPYTHWINRYSYYPYGPAAFPEYITRAHDGNYEVFPQPIEPFVLGFDYSRTYPDMVLYNDTPVGVPEKYQDLLLWKVIAEFADYDNNSKLYNRAAKNIEKYTFYLNRDKLPAIAFANSKFNN